MTGIEATSSLSELADEIERTHHAYLREALPHVDELLRQTVAVGGERHPELREIGATFRELRAELEPHLMKEERILFPMIRELESSPETPAFHCGSLQNPIGVMCAEHDKAVELLARLRTQTSGYAPPPDGVADDLYESLAALESDTLQHIHVENDRLFPGAVDEEARRTAP